MSVPFMLPYGVQHVFGTRTAFTADVWQDFWPGPTDRMPLVTTAVNLEVVSADAANSGTGTGAQTVALRLLNENFEPTEQVVTLDGITPVAVPGGPYMRCNQMRVRTAGSYGWTQNGNVDLRESGGGQVWRRMLADANEDRGAVYTIPAKRAAGVVSFSAKLFGRVANVALDVEAQFRRPGEAWQVVGMNQLDDVDNFTGSVGSRDTLGGEMSDLRISVFPTGTPTQAICSILMHEWADEQRRLAAMSAGFAIGL